jgi:hypothetical protein
MRSDISNLDTGLPEHARRDLAPRRHDGRGPSRRGVRHVRRRQVAPLPDAGGVGRRSLRPVATASVGFDRYYGFLDGETDQFAPDLTATTTTGSSRRRRPDGYHLSEDLVDHAIELVTTRSRSGPTVRSSLYLAFGATHAPHQAPGPTSSVPGRVRRRVGRRARQVVRAPKVPRPRAGVHRTRAAQPGRRAVGVAPREPPPAGRTTPGGLRRVPRAHRRPDGDWSTPSRASASSTTPCSS